jgi:hypothetical protein
MKNIFINSVVWSKEVTNQKGLPRPYADTTLNKEYKTRYGLAKIVPIPWQSKPAFKFGRALKLNKINEGKIYQKDLCPYCGIKIDNAETCARWNTADVSKLGPTGARVFSDVHPFHKECMKEARKFCPFMKTLNNNDFEYGKYATLKQKAIMEKETAENESKK